MPSEGLHPLDQVTATPMRRINSKDDERSGFFSSILSVAQNAATIMASKSDEEESKKNLKFNLDISPYQSQQDLPQVPTNNDTTPAYNDSDYRSSATDILPTQSNLLTSIVHFALVRDSPANTLGDGNLTLLHFDRKLAREANGKAPLDSTNKDEAPEPNRLVVSTNDGEQRVTRRRSPSKVEASSEEDGKDNDELALSELELMLDSASITEASSKKNREFHSAFRSVPSSERLISDYSCALSKDILVQGKLYLSQNFLFFKSNILGWVTNLQIPLQEVIQIEKKSTAVLFPTGIVIRTLHQKYVFASFITRDATFNLITKVWHNVLQNSVSDESSTKRRSTVISRGRLRSFRSTYKENASVSDHSSDGDDRLESIVTTDGRSDDETELTPERKPVARSETVSKGPEDQPGGDEEENSREENENEESPQRAALSRKGSSKVGGIPNPGPQTHEETSNGYSKDSNDVEIIEHVFKAPLGVVFTVLFGSDNSYFVKILKAQKNFDIEESKITGLSEGNEERNYSYTKPLNGPIGPKQTKCIVTDTLKACDFSKAVRVDQVTLSPDVPSGNSFKVITKFLFSWDKNNCTKMKVVTSVEWSARSWIKGPVEKGSIDGQKDFMKGLVTIVTDIISSGDSSEKSKNKRKKSKSVSRNPSAKEETRPEPTKEPTAKEKIMGLLESIGNLVPLQTTLFDSKLLGAFIVALTCICYSLFIMWLSGGRSSKITLDSSSDTGVKVVYINNQKFYLQPSLDEYLNNGRRRAMSEMKMWNWINEHNTHDSDKDVVRAYTDQEFSEVVKLTRDKMESIYKNLDI